MSDIVGPNCQYCHTPMGVNELDSESNGFYSAHWRCTHESPDGPFWVVSLLDGEPYRGGVRRGYTTMRRAESQARHYAETNSSRWLFVVYSGDAQAATFEGQLRITSQS